MELTAWQNFKSIRANLGEIVAGSGVTVTNNGDGTITLAATGTGFVTGTGTATHVPYWTGANTQGSSATFTFVPSTGVGVDTELVLDNDTADSTNDTVFRLKVGTVNGGQTKILFDTDDVYGTAHIGMPRGSSRYIGIGNGSDAGALNVVQIFNTSHEVYVNGPLSVYTNAIGGSTQTVSLVVSQNVSGVATGPAYISCEVQGPDKDPSFQLYTGKNGTGPIRFIMGLDNSSSSTLKLGFFSGPGTVTDVSLSTQFLTVTVAGLSSFILGNVSVVRAGAGSAVELLVTNTTNSDPTTNHAILRLNAGGGSGGDSKIVLHDGASSYRAIGLDNDDNDYLKFEGSETLGGGSTVMTLDFSSERVSIGPMPTSGANYWLNVVSPSNRPASQVLRNIGTNSAYLDIETTSASFDQYIGFSNGTNLWAIGANGATWKINAGNNHFGSGTTVFSVDYTTFDVTAAGFILIPTSKGVKIDNVQVLTDQQTGLGANISAATAGAAYGATEQAMLQALNDKLVALEPMLKTHGLVAT